MGLGSVLIYTILALIVLFFLSSHSPFNNHHSSHRHRRLKLRSNFTLSPSRSHSSHQPVPFDPLVAELERHREDKQWEQQHIQHAPPHESQPEWEDFMNAEDFINDEDKFNVTSRLLLLFPKIDVDPADQFVDLHELTMWNLQQAHREVLHRSQREMELHDKNHDGFVSFSEYDPPSWVKSADKESFGYDMGWWKEEHFNASDADGDGVLNLTEFNDFLHPADSNSTKLQQWLCKEEIRERDSDRDGKVNFKEFFHGLFDLVRNYDEESHNDSHHSDNSLDAPARKLFAQLDQDGDGLLSDIELLPIIGKLHPSEHYYAKQQSEYIISQITIARFISIPSCLENLFL
ncbi:calcium-binding EF hand-like protein [Medicago truncatula]|uniref:Calcium-binding EF hand-like protein n=1 Tax=Medicago truncatula TaxID=3880 RepID=A0A072VRY9_MEDTR|nr:calcium-binding EF hand-like protein [Medicago truncatula]